MSAKETLTAFMEHNFTKYSFPLVIKSDNGTAFRNELMACFSKYAGFRNAYVPPYNAQANGMAEQSVGRITRSLVSHTTQEFSNWPAMLPIVTFALKLHSSFVFGHTHHHSSHSKKDIQSLYRVRKFAFARDYRDRTRIRGFVGV
eukprot:1937469-Pleurochrysis_carterae.AAC.1